MMADEEYDVDEDVFEDDEEEEEIVDEDDEEHDEEHEINLDDQLMDTYDHSNTDTKEIIIVRPENRRTSSRLQKHELISVVGTMANYVKNISGYASYEGMTDEKEIAIKLIKDKKCPFMIKRYLNENTIELWKVNEMELPEYYV
jgi:ABC-type Zn2+ transport system substrate-binding protein/surface adhesin